MRDVPLKKEGRNMKETKDFGHLNFLENMMVNKVRYLSGSSKLWV